jgi:polyhydroxyalkanoate synthase
MDLIPKPDQVVAAAGNVAHSVLYGGLADLRPMPRSLIAEGPRRDVYHYRPEPGTTPDGDPVLLVTPLAAPAICFDLRRGCSLVEHLVLAGHPTYLVEYGEVSFQDRHLGMEHWIDTVVPTAIREASDHAGGRPVHVVGWSLGGIFALLVAADQPDLPIASVTSLGAPFDVTQVPIVAPLRPLLNLTDGLPESWGAVTAAYRLLGGAPRPLVSWAFNLASVQKLVTKPLAIATHLDDADYLAQLEAVDRFKANMIAYPGRTFGQLYHRFVKGNALAGGSFRLGERTIDLAALTAPVLIFAGANDGIAPVAAVRAVLPLLTGSREVRFEIVPGGHLGMLTGRAARTGAWTVLDAWVREWASAAASAPAPARRRTTKRAAAPGAAKAAVPAKTAAKKAPAVPSTAKKPATSAGKRAAPAKGAKPAPAKRTGTEKRASARSASTPAPPAIGANPKRRYGSATSRALTS